MLELPDDVVLYSALAGVALALLGLAVVMGLWLRSREPAQEQPLEPNIATPNPRQEFERRVRMLEIDSAQLHRRLTVLETTRSPRPAPAASELFEPALSQDDRPRGFQSSAAAERGPSRDQLMSDYRAAVEDLSGAGERFIQTYRPVALARRAGDAAYRSEEDVRGAFTWGVRCGPQWWLLPGYRALKDWNSHFSPQREQNAKDYFGDAFELDMSSTRFDAHPALAEERAEGLVIRQRGRITGFRS